MAFVPEDGTGLPDANSSVSVEFADEYFADRAISEWSTMSLELKRATLIAGTTYISTQYTYRGERMVPNQGTPFPRVGITEPSGNPVIGTPICVKHAVCELAFRARKGPLIPDPTVDEGGRPVKMKALRAGPLHKTVEFAGPGEIIAMARFPAVDALMCPWLIIRTPTFANGVKIAGAQVEGISNSRIAAIAANSDRYNGPMNENGADVGADDGTISF